jgi:hypothetical protein
MVLVVGGPFGCWTELWRIGWLESRFAFAVNLPRDDVAMSGDGGDPGQQEGREVG